MWHVLAVSSLLVRQLVHETPGGHIELWRPPSAHDVMARIMAAREAVLDDISRDEFPSDTEVFGALTAILRSPLFKDQATLVLNVMSNATFMRCLLAVITRPLPAKPGDAAGMHSHTQAIRFFLCLIEPLATPLRVPTCHACAHCTRITRTTHDPVIGADACVSPLLMLVSLLCAPTSVSWT